VPACIVPMLRRLDFCIVCIELPPRAPPMPCATRAVGATGVAGVCAREWSRWAKLVGAHAGASGSSIRLCAFGTLGIADRAGDAPADLRAEIWAVGAARDIAESEVRSLSPSAAAINASRRVFYPARATNM